MPVPSAWSISGSTEDRRRRFAASVRDMVGGSVGEFGVAVVMEDVPDEFFSAPASSSGNHHPPFDLGDGGLVRHSLVVAGVASELLRAYSMESSADSIVLGALLHDGWKSVKEVGGPWLDHTEPNHGTVGAASVLAAAERMGFGDASTVAACIRTHSSAWYDTATPIGRLATPEQQVVATADYIASRKSLEGWLFSA